VAVPPSAVFRTPIFHLPSSLSSPLLAPSSAPYLNALPLRFVGYSKHNFTARMPRRDLFLRFNHVG
jgi:hypothetical protein